MMCRNAQRNPKMRQRNRKKSTAKSRGFMRILQDQTARVTLPERRHLVQTYTWRGVPSTIALTRFTLGFHILLDRLWEWETLMPKVTPLPQISHLAISCTSNPWENRRTNPDGHSPYNIRCGPKLQGENGKKPKFFEIRLIFPEQFGIIDFVKIGMR